MKALKSEQKKVNLDGEVTYSRGDTQKEMKSIRIVIVQIKTK